MKTLYGYRNTADTLVSPVAAIGIFDGIHIGHKRVIGKVLSCRGHAGDRILITFDPHPQSVLRPDKTPPRIMSLDHRLSIFSKMGLDAVIVIRFTDYLAMMPPEEFVKNVLGTIGAKKVFVGSNFRFGRGRSGDAKMLKSIGASLGVDVQIVPPLMYGRKAVSSTWLRKLIKEGRLAKAEKLLRRPVSVYGTVIRGDERGRRLGTPTANIDPHQEVIPPPGVYAVVTDIDGRLYEGVLNVGYRPTFYGRSSKKREEPLMEVHLMGFGGGEIYGRQVEIFFIKRIRGEKYFRSSAELAARIKKDMIAAGAIFSSGKRQIHRICRYRGGKRA